MENELILAVADLNEDKVQALVKQSLAAGADPSDLLNHCRQGMAIIGKRFESGEYFLSDLIMAGEIFKSAASDLIARGGTSGPSRGKVVMGTVKGDIHDIGKDIVVTMLKAANFDVTDLGVDVPPARFVEAVQTTSATVVGISGLLTISFGAMKQTVDELKAAGLHVKVMIGGGPVTESVREMVGADAFGTDAQAAVAIATRWCEVLR